MAGRKKGNTQARKVAYVLENLNLKLTDKIESEGYTLDLKLVKMGSKNYKFIEVFLRGETLGHVDPYNILYFCNSNNFIELHPKAFRSRLGDLLMTKFPEGEMYITEVLLKVIMTLKYFTIYSGNDKPYNHANIEINDRVVELLDTGYEVV